MDSLGSPASQTDRQRSPTRSAAEQPLARVPVGSSRRASSSSCTTSTTTTSGPGHRIGHHHGPSSLRVQPSSSPVQVQPIPCNPSPVSAVAASIRQTPASQDPGRGLQVERGVGLDAASLTLSASRSLSTRECAHTQAETPTGMRPSRSVKATASGRSTGKRGRRRARKPPTVTASTCSTSVEQ